MGILRFKIMSFLKILLPLMLIQRINGSEEVLESKNTIIIVVMPDMDVVLGKQIFQRLALPVECHQPK